MHRIDAGLALDRPQIGVYWHWIGTRLASDWNPVEMDRRLVDIRLVLDWHQIGT